MARSTDSSERRVRITLRCLVEDLAQEVPGIDRPIALIDHPMLEEARRVAPASPRVRSGFSQSVTHRSIGFATAPTGARPG